MSFHTPSHDLGRSGAAPEPHHKEALGERIARLRTDRGLTQAQLAARVAISRVALSNLESARSVPGERTVALLAGVFGLEPLELVAGTGYPQAKVDRLPLVVARHTRSELLEAVLERDLTWLEGAPLAVVERVRSQWRQDLGDALDQAHDPGERARLTDLLGRVARS